MDKITLKFLADVLYVKDIISLDEYTDILSSCNFKDLDNIVDKMLKEEYNNYKSAREKVVEI